MTPDPPPPLRWGILGTGRILTKLGPAFALARGARLVAIASRDRERARAAAAAHGIARAHGSYEALLDDPEVDAVVNALPNGLHCEWTIRALEAGKHVLCEKPLACSCAEVDRMFAAAQAQRRWLLEGFMYRFHPQMAAIHARVAAGDIGQVVHIRSAYAGRGREPENPRYQRAAGGGALMDLGCYCVNFARFVAGGEPVRVAAHAHFAGGAGVDLTLSGALEFPAGLTAQFVCSFEAEGVYGAEIIGSEGRLVIPHPWLPPACPAEFVLTRAGRSETIRVAAPEGIQDFRAPFVWEIEHLGACIREQRAPSFPPGIDAERDSRGNSRVLDALLAAARSRPRASPVSS